MRHLAVMMEEKYQTPFQQVSYFGIEDMAESLYSVARFFKDPQLMKNAQELVREEVTPIYAELQEYKKALTGKKAVNVWMHGEFMMVDNGKMSKSLGNVYTIDDLLKMGYLPLSFRYFCLNAQYRNKINFTFEALSGAQTAYLRMVEAVLQHRGGQAPVEAEILGGWRQEFKEAVTDDLNIPKGLGVVWNALRYGEKSKDVYDFVLEADKVLGLGLSDAQRVKESYDALVQGKIPEEITELLSRRAQARKEKNWALSDTLRNEIKAKGYAVEDTAGGQQVKPL
jgi:cysteinyl-tRNA synthetase